MTGKSKLDKSVDCACAFPISNYACESSFKELLVTSSISKQFQTKHFPLVEKSSTALVDIGFWSGAVDKVKCSG